MSRSRTLEVIYIMRGVYKGGDKLPPKKITKQNIKVGLGNLDEKKEKEIINGMWSNIGRTFAEYIFLKDFKFKIIIQSVNTWI